MKYLILAALGLGIGYLLLLYRRPPRISYPIRPKWSHFPADSKRVWDGDRWRGEEDDVA